MANCNLIGPTCVQGTVNTKSVEAKKDMMCAKLTFLSTGDRTIYSIAAYITHNASIRSKHIGTQLLAHCRGVPDFLLSQQTCPVCRCALIQYALHK